MPTIREALNQFLAEVGEGNRGSMSSPFRNYLKKLEFADGVRGPFLRGATDGEENQEGKWVADDLACAGRAMG
ncbi:MAG: hypothetical protein HY287_06660, partial [Planctomycetes bacterium]|nr:hypothetical protein [Planctomycetota bacterium]